MVVACQQPLNSMPSFARGLPILLVDHDPTSLASTSSLLGRYSFNVTGTELPSMALSLVQEKKNWFKLVMADIDKINDESFSIIRELIKEKIPVILMSANRHKNTAGRSLAVGASYFLYKPLSPENLKVLWQHAFRRRTMVPLEKRNAQAVKSKGKQVLGKEYLPNKKIDKATTTRKAPTDQIRKKRGHTAEGNQIDERCAKKPKVGKSRFAPLNVKGKGTTLVVGAKRSNDGKDGMREYKRPRIDSERVDSDDEDASEEDWSTGYMEDDSIKTCSPARRRIRQAVWNPELNRKFTVALSELGDDARPKTILKMMDAPYLTIRQVASHLQKYKNQVQRLCNVVSASNVSSDRKSGSSNGRVEPRLQPDTQAPVSGQVGQASIYFRGQGYADTSQQYFYPNSQLSFNNCSQIPNQVLQQAQNQYRQLSNFPANPNEQSSHSSHYEEVNSDSRASSHNLNYPGEQSKFSNDNLSMNQGLNENEGSTYQVPGTDFLITDSINPEADPTNFASLCTPPQIEGSLVLPGFKPVSRMQNQPISLTAVTGNATPTVSPQVEVEDKIFTDLAEIFRPAQTQHIWTELSNSSDPVDQQHQLEFDSILNKIDNSFVPPKLGREIECCEEFAALINPQGTSDNLVPSQGNQYKEMNQRLTQSLAGDNHVPSKESQYNVMNQSQGLDLVAEVEPQPQAWFMNQSLTSDNPAPSQENQYHVMNEGLDHVTEVEPQPQDWFINQSLTSDDFMPSQGDLHYVMNQELNLELEPQHQAWFMNQTWIGNNPVTCQENRCHVMNQGLDLIAEGELQPQTWFPKQSLTGDNLVSSPENQHHVMNEGLNLQVEPQPEAWYVSQSQTSDNPMTCEENQSHAMSPGLDLIAEAEAWLMDQSLISDNLAPSPEDQHSVMSQGLNIEVEHQPEAWIMKQTLNSNIQVTSQENQYNVTHQGSDLVAGEELQLQPQAQAFFINQHQPDYDASLRIEGLEDLRVLPDEPMLDEINQFSEWLANIFGEDDIPKLG